MRRSPRVGTVSDTSQASCGADETATPSPRPRPSGGWSGSCTGGPELLRPGLNSWISRGRGRARAREWRWVGGHWAPLPSEKLEMDLGGRCIRNRCLHTAWLKATEMYLLTVQEASVQSVCRRRLRGRICCLPSPSVWRLRHAPAFLGLWTHHCGLCFHLHMLCSPLCFCICVSPFYKDTCHRI